MCLMLLLKVRRGILYLVLLMLMSFKFYTFSCTKPTPMALLRADHGVGQQTGNDCSDTLGLVAKLATTPQFHTVLTLALSKS